MKTSNIQVPLHTLYSDEAAAYRAVLRGEAPCSVELAMQVMMPSWLDASRSSKVLLSRVQLPTSRPVELAAALSAAIGQPSEATAREFHSALIAALSIGRNNEEASACLSQALEASILTRAWLAPSRWPLDWSALAACRSATLDTSPDEQVRAMATAVTFLAFSTQQRARSLLPDTLRANAFRSKFSSPARELMRHAEVVWRSLGRLTACQEASVIADGDDDFGVAEMRPLEQESSIEPLLLPLGEIGVDALTERARRWIESGLVTDPRTLDAIEELTHPTRYCLGSLRRARELIGFHLRRNTSEEARALQREMVAWAAVAGDGEAASDAAAVSLAFATSRVSGANRISDYFGAAIGFLGIASASTSLSLMADADRRGIPAPSSLIRFGGIDLVRLAQRRVSAAVANANWSDVAEGLATLPAIWSEAGAVSERDRDECVARLTAPSAGVTPPDRLVVVKVLAKSSGAAARDIEKDWRSLVQEPLRLVPVTDLASAYDTLRREFPHFRSAIEPIVNDLAGRATVYIRPTLLVGPPGCGKSHLTRRLATLLGLPSTVYPASAASDASLAGTSRQWSTGRPSIPLSQIRQTRVANPLLVVDEIDKAATSSQNGRITDCLLGLLEPSSAKSVFDPYLETEVDLSHVSWIATANDVSELPAPLLDRFRIIRVEGPTAAHLTDLLPIVVSSYLTEKGLDARWVPSLTEEEIEIVRHLWKPTSIRRLGKLVEAVLERRCATALWQ